MPERGPSKSWFLRVWPYLAVALLSCAVTALLIAWSRYASNPPVEIRLKPAPASVGAVYIGGAVISPGYYSVRADDTLADLLKSAGGMSDNASLDGLSLHVAVPGEADRVQRVDINRAPLWLLEALPGIGEARAQAIIRYRQSNGGFRSPADISRVDGISAATYERIKDLITVAE